MVAKLGVRTVRHSKMFVHEHPVKLALGTLDLVLLKQGSYDG